MINALLARDFRDIDFVRTLRKRTRPEEAAYVHNLAINSIGHALYNSSLSGPTYDISNSTTSKKEQRLFSELITLLQSNKFITDEDANALLNPDLASNSSKPKPESIIHLDAGSKKFTCCWQNHEVEDNMFIPYEDGMVCLDCGLEAELITDEQIQNALCPQTQNLT